MTDEAIKKIHRHVDLRPAPWLESGAALVRARGVPTSPPCVARPALRRSVDGRAAVSDTPKVLAIDVGGSHVKLLTSGEHDIGAVRLGNGS